jgi:hypothetical protein
MAKIKPKAFVKNMSSLTVIENDPLTNSIRYYGIRIAHRWAMMTLVGSTLVYWIFLVTTSTNIFFLRESGAAIADAARTNETIASVNNTLSSFILRWSIIFVAATLALVSVKRFRKFEKPQLVDSLITAIFCLGSVALSQQILRFFLSNYLN